MRALAMYASELERAGLTAHQCNPYVIDYLLGCKRIPHGQSDSIGLGDESEAIAYAQENRHLWIEAIDVLHAFNT